ncbi:phosphoglycerate dehydrogenase-like enzyme [Microbacterium ginsengiterrae]|uniref:Phosphoglycerate dehydrogenase-like enzyme n=1 Tax=Microbacterium ginsengiterrae TaxID=546115 RepID=A0A7W9CCB7_9MICO|nr:D-2-hydroxyacid dehydrogenase [Microbacterium ginsengiterrae]MBB5742988.1 phosphoglycerate dehydrogenase-like enzyme [Microbacterium ginsengiterrae]
MPVETVLVRSDDAAADARRWTADFPDVRFVTDDDVGADVTVVAGRVHDAELDDLTGLSWVHSWAAGVEGDLGPRMRAQVRDGHTVVTSSAGNGAVPLAEHAMMLALMLDRDAPRWAQAQRARRWERRTHGELLGRTLGIYGYGNVGRELAVRAAAFGMRVIALRRRTGTDDPHVARFYQPEEILDFAARCDVLVVAAPLTAGTRGAIGEREISALPAGASVIVVSRGGIVDDDALLRALRAGRIRAGLDAHAHEPLPADSPYWGEPSVIVTPHNGATTLATARRGREIFVENLRRRTSGKPMVNLVDVTALG